MLAAVVLVAALLAAVWAITALTDDRPEFGSLRGGVSAAGEDAWLTLDSERPSLARPGQPLDVHLRLLDSGPTQPLGPGALNYSSTRAEQGLMAPHPQF
jgi:hypothetical protein